MSDRGSAIGAKSLWTIGAYGASAVLRFATNIVLSHLLGPAVLGVVVIAQAVRAGTELLTDMGFEQNIVHSEHGDDPHFLNTIWTMQIVRGAAISLVFAAAAPFLAAFYRIDVAVLLAMSAAPLLNSLVSTSIFTLSKWMDVKTRNLFELVAEAIGLVLNVTLAFALRTVWAPILSILLALAARAAMTYLLKHPPHRLTLDRVHAAAIFHFSKWIMLSSLALYAAIYVDRLFLGRVVTLSVLGIYGLAKAISDLPQTVAGRLSFQIVFPFVAHNRDGLDPAARAQLGRTRAFFLLLVAVGVATVMAWSDWAVRILYSSRYVAAGWMVCLLLVGSWIGVLASLNEATAFGRGRPRAVSAGNLMRVLVIAVVLPIGFAAYGLPAALLALPAGELVRYGVITTTQRGSGALFVRQDLVLSAGLLALFGGWMALRAWLHLGVPWALIG